MATNNNYSLDASLRESAGKGAARQTRRDGDVPAVIYGGNDAPVTISLKHNELIKQLNQGGFFTQICELTVGKETHKVLARDIQFHPVNDQPLHVDFLRVTDRTKIVVSVPSSFVNEEASPGLKAGGILNVVRHEIELRCRANAIPETIEFDLTDLTVGDSIHISKAKLPDGANLTTDHDFTVATIAAPSALRSSEEEETEEGTEGEEGENNEAEASEGSSEESADTEAKDGD